MSTLKTKMNSLQNCGASHKMSHTLVTCVTDGLKRVTLMCWQSLWAYWMQGVFQVNENRSPTCCPVFPHQPPPMILLDRIYCWCKLSMFNYRSFQSACGDFHSSISSHTTSSNQVVYFLSWLFYWKSLIFRKSQ